jgi:hypothetical protein
MEKITQEKNLKEELRKSGSITRNDSLRNFDKYGSRLSALIYNLKEQGWVFKTERVEYGNKKWDFRYTVVVEGN